MYLIFPECKASKKRKAVAVTFTHRQKKKKDSQLFASLPCSRCLGSSRKKQRLKRKLAFFVCSQACHTTSSTAIFSTAVGIIASFADVLLSRHAIFSPQGEEYVTSQKNVFEAAKEAMGISVLMILCSQVRARFCFRLRN